MSIDKEAFLARWARRKRQAAAETPAKADAKPVAPPEPEALPSPDSLTFESDFAAFLRANVEESVKRAALKKLLHDPRFNVMDGLDVYIDDYTKSDPIPEEMLKTLEHARSTLFGPKQEPVETAKAEEQEPAEQKPVAAAQKPDPNSDTDGDTRQDA